MPSRLLTPPPPPSPSPGRHHATLLAVVVSALLLAVLSLLLLLFYLYRSLRHASAGDRTLPLDSPAASSLRRFSFRELRSATASFDPSRSLGRGASAEVFRGLLPDGKSVAVKHLDLPSSSSPSSSPPFSSSDREFHNELHVLAALPGPRRRRRGRAPRRHEQHGQGNGVVGEIPKSTSIKQPVHLHRRVDLHRHTGRRRGQRQRRARTGRTGRERRRSGWRGGRSNKKKRKRK